MDSIFKPKLVSCLKRYDRKTFMSDLMAGIIVGIVALPLAIAFAIASGVSPEKGIITAIVAGFIISAIGGSRVQIGGPTGALIIIVSGIIQNYDIQGLIIATLMAGVFLILLGVLKLGTIIKFIPYPIIVGFTSGIALTIFSTQIKDLFGLQIAEVPSDFIDKWGCYFSNFASIDLWSTLIGIATIAILIIVPRISKKIPGSLVAIILMTLAVLLLKKFGIHSVDTIGDRFSITSEIPSFQLPSLSFEDIKNLILPAITLAMLGAIESLLSATVADGVISSHHNSNTELIAQGVANIASAAVGGIPATGAIARTMTNINNGGRTPVAGIIHAVVLLAIYLFLMPLASYIPMSCLAGILVVVAYNMSGWRSFASIFKNPVNDVIVLIITFLLTVLFDLTIAIGVGVLIACLLFMKRVSETSDIKIISDGDDINAEDDGLATLSDHLIVPKEVEVYEINGPFFFGAGNKFEDLMAMRHSRAKVRILRMRKVSFIDSTGLHNLCNICNRCHKKNIAIVLSGVNPDVYSTLEKADFFKIVKQENVCKHIDIAIERAKQICEESKRD